MVGTEEESFEWLDIDKHPEEVRILQDTVDVLSLPRPGEVRLGTQSIGNAFDYGEWWQVLLGASSTC